MADLNNTLVRGNLRVTSDTEISGKVYSGPNTIDGQGTTPLILKNGSNNYSEGLRIMPTGSWSDIVLGGNDASESAGISSNSWFIGNNNGNFYLTRNGSNSGDKIISNTGSRWVLKDNATDTPLMIQGGTGATYLEFQNSSGSTLGYYAFDSSGNPCIYSGGNIRILTENGGNAVSASIPYGFSSRGSSDWSGVSGTMLTDWSSSSAGDVMFKDDNGKINVITDGRFYQGIDIYGASKRVLDEYDISHTQWGDADTTDGLHAHSGRNDESNKLVRTDSNGYIQCGYINSSYGDEGNYSAPARIWGTNGSDSYLRTYRAEYVNVGYASVSDRLQYLDTRDVAVSVADAVGYDGIKIEFKNKNTSSIPSTGTWTAMITLDGYSDNSGGYPSQLGFSMSDLGANRHLYMRSPSDSSTWGAWKEFAFSDEVVPLAGNSSSMTGTLKVLGSSTSIGSINTSITTDTSGAPNIFITPGSGGQVYIDNFAIGMPGLTGSATITTATVPSGSLPKNITYTLPYTDNNDDGTLATQYWVTGRGYSTVSGSNDGTYWTSININGTSKSIPGPIYHHVLNLRINYQLFAYTFDSTSNGYTTLATLPSKLGLNPSAVLCSLYTTGDMVHIQNASYSKSSGTVTIQYGDWYTKNGSNYMIRSSAAGYTITIDSEQITDA